MKKTHLKDILSQEIQIINYNILDQTLGSVNPLFKIIHSFEKISFFFLFLKIGNYTL